MSIRTLAHISDLSNASFFSVPTLAVATAVLALALLTVEHVYVKHGGLSLRSFRQAFAGVAVVTLAAIVAPLPVTAQDASEPVGLPDLISDPSYIWFNKTVESPTGETLRVMAFDGYIHNIGTGSLEVTGNPQLPNGMKQVVFNGEVWEEVASPLVQFETSDGHNHFHLMDAVDYALWTDDRTELIGDASKVGFCLIDTEQLEEQYNAYYTIRDSDYCGVDNPESTELTMGISPGWRDTYEANVTLQWVNISNVRPGYYWVSSVMDPGNVIVESNEDNNDAVFSANRYAVDGYNARPLPPQAVGEIQLKAAAYGVTGAVAFVIDEAPANGWLDVPAGFDLATNSVRYTPNPGFVGTDTFSYYAHDSTSGFPYDPAVVTVEVVVTAGDDTAAADAPEPTSDPSQFDVTVDASDWATYRGGTTMARVLAPAELPADARPVQWWSRGLPPGVTIDPQSGVISGVPTLAGDFDAEVYATFGEFAASAPMTLTVEDTDTPEIIAINDFSTIQTRRVTDYLGRGVPGASYEVTGLPAGVQAGTNLPLIDGTPEEIGEFDITLSAMIDGDVVETIEFTWTVRPSTRPAFTL